MRNRHFENSVGCPKISGIFPENFQDSCVSLEVLEVPVKILGDSERFLMIIWSLSGL